MKKDKEKLLAFADSLDWQDIETAPKDGQEILIKEPDGAVWLVHWYDGVLHKGWAANFGDLFIKKATHWMPVPTGEAAAVIKGLLNVYEVILWDYDYNIHQDGGDFGLERALRYIETAMKKAAGKIAGK